MAEQYDVIVLGGGPGGYVAAIRASQLGLKACVVEREHMGGICLNWGCIPTKALLRTSELHHMMHRLDEFGLSAKGLSFDVKKVVKRSRDVAAQLSGGISQLMKKNKVDVYEGLGKIDGKNGGKHKLVVRKWDAKKGEGDKIADLEAKNIIIATGARARSLPGLEADGKQVWTYKEAMTPSEMPKKLLVVGSGAIGIEFASFYHHMGVDVTVVEVMDRVMPVEDEEISKFAQKQFEAQGLTIKTKTTVTELKKAKDSVTATMKDKDGKESKLKVDKVIMAVGIVGNSEGLGLDLTKVKVERNHIVTDPMMQTDEPGIYAIGDVTGAPWLAHKASHEGMIAAEHIAGKNDVHPIKKSNIPGCTYCYPQVASVGLTEAKAKEEGYDVKVGKFPFIGNGKAIALGEPEGLVKTIFDASTGELLGAHMIGAEVTEMIQGFVIGKTMEACEEDFMHAIFPHPTLSEMMHESVLDADGRVVHM